CCSSFSRPDSPVSALDTPYPSPLRRNSRPSRISDSSSTTRMEPLDMNRFPGRGEFEPEGSAFTGRGPHIDLARMFLDDSITYRKSQARAAPGRFRREERIEDPLQILAGNSGAV